MGSFLTVCIHRIPQGKSVVVPRSKCPSCGVQIVWYDNIPVWSFLWLRGQCRMCQQSIPFRYPLIEIVNGLGYLLVVWRFGLAWSTVIYAGLFSVFLVVTWIDWDHQIIPDLITLPGIVVGVLCAGFWLPTGWGNSLMGLLVGGGVLLILAWASPFLFGKEGMGGGDIKFLAMVGAFLGWKAALLALMIASVVGACCGVALLLARVMERGQYIPFGPYLALGSLTAMLWGNEIWTWYFNGLI
ncbi:MAG: prepilin peptidase [Nitrospira sp.]|nr:prepilin peptidase [Nitrospira sp.]